MSLEIREELELVREDPSGWLLVMDRLQRRVAREFGLSEAVGLVAMRKAEDLLPGDSEVPLIDRDTLT